MAERYAGLGDNELVQRILEGEKRGYDELVRRYQRPVTGFLYNKIRDDGRAEDLFQEACIRLVRNIHRFDSSHKFSTWFYTIADNLAKNELRDRARSVLVYYNQGTSNDQPVGSIEYAAMSQGQHAPDQEVSYHRKQLSKIIYETIDELPGHHREVFVLREVEDRTYDEIAEMTGVTLGTVKSRLNRARTSFAERIAPKIDYDRLAA